MIKPFKNYFKLDTDQLNDLFNLISEDGNKEIKFEHFEELIYILDDNSKLKKNEKNENNENLLLNLEKEEKKEIIFLNLDQMKFLENNYLSVLEIFNKEQLFYYFKNACIYFDENLMDKIMIKIKKADLCEAKEFLKNFKIDEKLPEFNMPSLSNIFEMPLLDKSTFLLKSIKIGFTKFFNFFNKFGFEKNHQNFYYKLILNFQDDLFHRFERISEIFQEYENYYKIMKSNLNNLENIKRISKKQEDYLIQENLNLKSTIGILKRKSN